MKKRQNTTPTEHAEQVALMQLVSLHLGRWPELRLLYAIPNGGHRHIAVAKKLAAEGVRPGVPDLCLPVARGGYHGLYVELKRTKGGAVSDVQGDWHKALVHEGYAVVVCYGCDQAWGAIANYMRMTRVVAA